MISDSQTNVLAFKRLNDGYLHKYLLYLISNSTNPLTISRYLIALRVDQQKNLLRVLLLYQTTVLRMSDNDIIQLLQKEIINDFNREAVSELLSKLLVGEIEEAKV